MRKLSINLTSKSFLFILMIAIFASCQKEEIVEKFNFNIQEIKEQQALWNKMRPNEYTYELFNSNVSKEDIYQIKIKNNEVMSIVNMETKNAQELNPFEAITIDNIFQFLDATHYSVYTEENILIKNIELLFDPIYGCPQKVAFDFKTKQAESYRTLLIEVRM